MAAAVADFRPAAPRARQDQEGRRGRPRSLELEPTDDVLGDARRPPPPRPDAGRLRRRARRGRDRLRAREARAQGPGRRRGQRRLAPGIGFDAADNEVTVVTADGEHAVPRATKAEVAGAILDEV